MANAVVKLDYSPNAFLLHQYHGAVSNKKFDDIMLLGLALAEEVGKELEKNLGRFSDYAVFAVDYTQGLVFAGFSKEDAIMQAERFNKETSRKSTIDHLFTRKGL
jgi:hypothetical protein